VSKVEKLEDFKHMRWES